MEQQTICVRVVGIHFLVVGAQLKNWRMTKLFLGVATNSGEGPKRGGQQYFFAGWNSFFCREANSLLGMAEAKQNSG